MRQVIIDSATVTKELIAEVTALKIAAEEANRRRWQIVLLLGVVLGFAFIGLQSSLDSFPGHLMRLMTTDTPFRTALCR